MIFLCSQRLVNLFFLPYLSMLIITGNNAHEIEKFKSVLTEKFLIKDLGELKYFLGIEILKDKNGVCLSQRKYCLDLLKDFGLLGCKPMKSPLEANVVLASKESQNDKLLTNVTEYQKLIGKLIYLTITRPDIAYSVQCLSQYMHAPLQSHLKVAFRVLRYLKGSPGKGIVIDKSKEFGLCAYSDADWGKCLSSRRSVSGYLVYLNGSLVSWKSKKQATVSRSSAESEYRCLATTCEIVCILKILKDLNVQYTLPINIFCDCKPAIQIGNNPVFHERTKHFEINLHLVREKVSNGVINLVKIVSDEQPTDLLTKGLNIVAHHYLCSKLRLKDLFQS
uniref:uncharacterized mitochondrial protein AtMg00810-like n=1 Tax=Erigeron canadensis TaxID=72917 RepID=UPI001CB942D0|nr:uncharacterized mitochondrial protein AtMg00810-like [Erigeron canadensis]